MTKLGAAFLQHGRAADKSPSEALADVRARNEETSWEIGEAVVARDYRLVESEDPLPDADESVAVDRPDAVTGSR